MIGFLRRTILGGVLMLAPALAAFYLLRSFVRAIQEILTPIAEKLPVSLQLFGKEVLIFILATLLCFILGVIAQTSSGRVLQGYLERNVLVRLPGYSFFKRLAENIASSEKEFAKPVLVQFDDSAQFGFLIDEAEQATVFIPGSPGVAAGSIFVVARSRVRRLDAGAQQVVQSLAKWGFESQRLLTPKA